MSDPAFDFWYAVNNTEILLRPSQRLETFGSTVVDYQLITEMMDAPDRVRVREGRLQAYRPEIITPQSFLETALEGFSDAESRAYVDWLREHERDLLILKYGFNLRKQETSEQLITDRIEAVVDRAKADLTARQNPLSALLVGVDEPWEVCLLKLMVDLVQQSGPHHAREIGRDPQGHHHEIDRLFREAARDRSRVEPLAARLRELRLFGQYEDRFYALVRAAR